LEVIHSDVWQSDIPGHDNINEDPLFIDSTNNFELTSESPCLIAGFQENTPEQDINGKEWPDKVVNIGAYINNYYQAEKTKPLVFFRVDTLESLVGESIVFTDQSVPDKNKNIIERIWDFGDGSPLLKTLSETVTHTYRKTGNLVIFKDTIFLNSLNSENYRNSVNSDSKKMDEQFLLVYIFILLKYFIV